MDQSRYTQCTITSEINPLCSRVNAVHNCCHCDVVNGVLSTHGVQPMDHISQQTIVLLYHIVFKMRLWIS